MPAVIALYATRGIWSSCVSFCVSAVEGDINLQNLYYFGGSAYQQAVPSSMRS